MIQELMIPELPPTLNALNNMHHMTRAKMKGHWSDMVRTACRVYNIKPIKRASITMELYFPDRRRRDLDNYSGLGFKFLLDGLVENGILPDDSISEVVELRIVYGGTSKPPHVMIYIAEV